MFENLTTAERQTAIHRITALWALNECGLGGLLHAFQSPFTGLIVGSIAMMCIVMICMLSLHKWSTVMTALLTVLIIKAVVSPHSSPTAYLAVAFQGITGAIILRYIKYFPAACMLFVSLGLIESAFQRLLTLTILYGNSLWDAVNIWGEWVTQRWDIILPVSTSEMVIYTYLIIHLAAGIFIGWMVYRTIREIDILWGQSEHKLSLQKEGPSSAFQADVKKRNWLRILIPFGILLFIVIVYLFSGKQSGFRKGLIVVIRTIVMLAIWYLVAAPLLTRAIRRYLSRKHQKLSIHVDRTFALLPDLVWLVRRAWSESKQLPFFARWKTFILHTLLYILQYIPAHESDPDRTDPRP